MKKLFYRVVWRLGVNLRLLSEKKLNDLSNKDQIKKFEQYQNQNSQAELKKLRGQLSGEIDLVNENIKTLATCLNDLIKSQNESAKEITAARFDIQNFRREFKNDF
jgi:predicted  nucleic acid-binding Zn-ribbon protein